MPTLRLAIPTKCQIHANTITSFLNIYIPGYQIEFRTLVGKSNIDQARSMIITQWYDEAQDDDLFLFIDADQTFTQDDIISLIELQTDIAIGVYPSMGKYPCCRPIDQEKFQTGEDTSLFYGATGMMLIRKPLLREMEKFIQEENFGLSRYYISQDFPRVVPFFKQRLVRSETMPDGKPEWLGEDYSFCWIARRLGASIKAHLSPTIGHEVIQRLSYYPEEYKRKIWGENSIVYYTGASRLPWSPTDPETKGLGGSEMAVIQLSRYWASVGYAVTVYGNVAEGQYEGVTYLHHRKFNLNDQFKIIVLWRSFGIAQLPMVKARRIWIDLHDLSPYYYHSIDSYFPLIESIMLKSESHAASFPSEWRSKMKIEENGVPAKYFLPLPSIEEKWQVRHRLVYASSYERGLIKILQWSFPLIKRAIPEAELHIYYGANLLSQETINRLQILLQQDGVFEHGLISQDLLIQIKRNSGIHFYPSTHGETDCISIKESALAGCLPIVSSLPLFEERPYTLRIPGNPQEYQTHRKAAAKVINLINSRQAFEEAHQQMREHLGKIKNWETVGQSWLDLHYLLPLEKEKDDNQDDNQEEEKKVVEEEITENKVEDQKD